MHVSHPEHAHWPLMRLHYVILKWLYRSPSYSDAESSTAKTIWINVKIQESLPRQ